MARAGEFAMRHGPWGLPAVCAARSLPTPRLRSSRNRVRPRFHCFHTTDRSRRRSHASWIWASQSNARSPATVGLISGSCSSARVFAPRFFQAPPRGECYFTLALRYDFTSIRLSKGLSPSSCRNMLGTHKKARAVLALAFVFVQLVFWVRVGGLNRVVRPGSKPHKTREEWSKLERQLVTNRGDGDWSGFDHLYFVAPRVEFDASAERQRSDLIELAVVQFRCRRHEGGKASDLSLFSRKAVSQMRSQQGRKRCRARLQLLQIETGRPELLCIRRILQQLNRFCIRRSFLFRIVTETEILVRGFIREKHAVIKGKLAAEIMAEDDMRQLMRKNGRQAGFIGKGINQSTADDDRIAYAERFKRIGDQHARTNRTRQVDIVGDLNVVDDSL